MTPFWALTPTFDGSMETPGPHLDLPTLPFFSPRRRSFGAELGAGDVAQHSQLPLGSDLNGSFLGLLYLESPWPFKGGGITQNNGVMDPFLRGYQVGLGSCFGGPPLGGGVCGKTTSDQRHVRQPGAYLNI